MVRKFERTAVLIVLAASPFWLPAIPSPWSGSLRSTVVSWVKPGLYGGESARRGFGGAFSGVLELFSVQEENRLLRAQLEALRAHEETHHELSQENERLRGLLKFRAQTPWRLQPAEVIGRELGPWSRGILLDRGAQDGIRAGMAVIVPKGLVGRISEVGPDSSRAVLMTDAHFRVMGTLSRRRLPGLVMGSSGGQCLLTYLPLDLELQEGEAVVSAGGRSFCPEGVPLGVVGRVWKDPSEMFQTARIDPAASLGTVEEVLIVLSPTERD
ncbi:MAG: rod shape-determining protein MreC [Candidatus Omnitrophica bacterium]|nr:rod shape-determining protein MreC [Candidatus Omnitrophota bacterium]